MAGLLEESRLIAATGVRLAFAVSLGRDSAVMLHSLSRFTDLKKHAFFHWSHYPEMLPYHRRYLDLVDRTYGIKVQVHLWPEVIGAKEADFVRDFLESNGCGLALFGYRMDESLQRRGMLNRLKDGIDNERKCAYPLRRFTAPKIRSYARNFRLPLSIEYQMGMRHDMTEHRGVNAFFLRHFIGEADYQAAIRQVPEVEIDYTRVINDKDFIENFSKKVSAAEGKGGDDKPI